MNITRFIFLTALTLLVFPTSFPFLAPFQRPVTNSNR